MQAQVNNSTNDSRLQEPLGYINQGGRGEDIGSPYRYLTQLYILLRTARRQNNARVVCALRGLIAKYRGMA
jgi:hypothetical protein